MRASRGWWVLALGLSGLVGGVGLASRPAAAAPPVGGILLVTVDTLRADHVGAYGGPDATPALDALAREGTLLTGACTPIPSTGPAHASLFTGLHPWHHRVLDNAVPLGPDLPHLAAQLRERGFETAAFVSSYVVHPRFGLAEGFDTYSFRPTRPYTWRGSRRAAFWTRGEETMSDARRWITEHADRPFFVWVHLFDPHTPYEPPPGYALPAGTSVTLASERLPRGVRSRRQLESLVRAYRGEVVYADAQIGRLVDRLRSLGLLDTTAVVVTADHGEGLGDHGLLEHGENLFDELVRVPLLVRAPGVGAGRRLEGPAQLEDVMPTLLSLAGARVPDGLDGVDLAPWLRGEVDRSPRAAVVGRRKLFRGEDEVVYFQRSWPDKWIGPATGPGTRYRLDVDPGELGGEGAAGMPPPLVGLAPDEVAAPLPTPDAEAREALEALGYLEPGASP